MEFKDYYQTLGVARDADEKAIKKAYRDQARKYHPDVYAGPDADEKFKAINEAHQVLSDADKRSRYDRFGADWERYQSAPEGDQGDFAQWYTGRSGTPGSRRTRTSYTTTGPEDGNGFSDFFDLLFGSQGGGRGGRDFGGQRVAQQPRRGEDFEHPIDVTLAEAFGGTARTFELSVSEPCRDCGGTGLNGYGVCPTCGGNGSIPKRTKLEITIPPGVREGSRVRVAGKGGPGRAGGPAGDIYLNVHLRKDARFELEGHDLRTEVEVPLYTALLGGEVVVPTLTGKLALTIAPETQNGRIIRLRGQGWPTTVRGERRGDLKVKVKVMLPTDLDDEEQQLFQQLAEHRQGAKVTA